MRKFIVALLGVLVNSTTVFCQKYVPFPTENAEWNIRYYSVPYEFQLSKSVSLLSYSLQGDTIIGSKTYNKVCLNVGTTEKPVYVGVGGMREENKKIYYIGQGFGGTAVTMYKSKIQQVKNCTSSVANTTVETLLYDFNVKVGDAVQWGYTSNIVSSVDSIKIGKAYRKCYRFQYGNDLVIEGIGSVVKGLFGSITMMLACGSLYMEWEHICFSQDGEMLYMNPGFKACGSPEKWSDRNYLQTGTQWYYGTTIYDIVPYPNTKSTTDYYSLKSVGDTIINGKSCYVIAQLRNGATCFGFNSRAYVYQSTDTVYFYNSQSKNFSPLYVYGAGKGDSWIINYPQGDVKVQVDSVGSIIANGETINVQYVTYKIKYFGGTQSSLESRIVSNFGDINYQFMADVYLVPTCDEFLIRYNGLRCFVHPEFGTYKLGTVACDYVSEVKNPEIAQSVKVYIAQSGNLMIESRLTDCENAIFEVLDVRGRKFLSVEVSLAKNTTVSFGNYSKGLYLYRLVRNGKTLSSGKIVKW